MGMSVWINMAVPRLFGSETRAKVLGLLADSPEPKTGYEISKVLGINPSKVYDVLRKLEGTGFLGVIPDRSRYRRYFLSNEDLRRFFLKNVRIAAEDDWFGPTRIRDRERAFEMAKALKVEVPEFKGSPRNLPNLAEFRRPPEKDRALKRVATKSSNFNRKRKSP